MLTFAVVKSKIQMIMKKILFSIIAMMAVITVQAQSIHASWHSLQPVVETEPDGSFTAQSFTYTFNPDGTYIFKFAAYNIEDVNELTIASEPAQTMEQEVATNIKVKGTYTYDGEKLTLKPNMDTYKAELISISQNGRVTNSASVKTSVNTKLNSRDFKAKFNGTKTYTVRVGEASMTMKDGGQEFNYMRFATIKD